MKVIEQEREVFIKWWSVGEGPCWHYYHIACLSIREQKQFGIYRISGEMVHGQAKCFVCKKLLRAGNEGA